MLHSVMRGEYFWWLWWSFGLTHPCSTTLWTPDHSTSIIMRQCKDKGHISHLRKATIHIQRGEGGKGVKRGTLHWGGWWLLNLDHIWFLCSKTCISVNQDLVYLLVFLAFGAFPKLSPLGAICLLRSVPQIPLLTNDGPIQVPKK